MSVPKQKNKHQERWRISTSTVQFKMEKSISIRKRTQLTLKIILVKECLKFKRKLKKQQCLQQKSFQQSKRKNDIYGYKNLFSIIGLSGLCLFNFEEKFSFYGQFSCWFISFTFIDFFFIIIFIENSDCFFFLEHDIVIWLLEKAKVLQFDGSSSNLLRLSPKHSHAIHNYLELITYAVKVKRERLLSLVQGQIKRIAYLFDIIVARPFRMNSSIIYRFRHCIFTINFKTQKRSHLSERCSVSRQVSIQRLNLKFGLKFQQEIQLNFEYC